MIRFGESVSKMVVYAVLSSRPTSMREPRTSATRPKKSSITAAAKPPALSFGRTDYIIIVPRITGLVRPGEIILIKLR